MIEHEIVIGARFNGPPGSGNGGYSCAMLGQFIDGPSRVRLLSPPPLDKTLTAVVTDDGRVELFDGDIKLATAAPEVLEIEIPPAPSLEQATRGRENFPFWEDHHIPGCFVCGTDRPHPDGLDLQTGPVHDFNLVAAPWTPPPDLVDENGNALPEVVWSALDCPGCYGALGDRQKWVLLGEMQAELYAPVPANETHVVYAWPLGVDGRKNYGGVAVANQEGEVLAASLTNWIELKSVPPS